MACSTVLFATCEPKTAAVEFRVSYFRPSSSLLRSVYGNAGIDYQLTGTVSLDSLCCKNSQESLKGVNLWWAVDYIAKNGQSLGDEPAKTRFWMIPVTAGLKYIHPAKNFRPYVGLGLRYFFVHTSNNYDFVRKNINANGLGGVVEGGMLLTFCEKFLLDVFVAYSHGKVRAPSNSQSNVETSNLQVGGFNFGLGVSYAF
jgi:outer membrane protein W